VTIGAWTPEHVTPADTLEESATMNPTAIPARPPVDIYPELGLAYVHKGTGPHDFDETNPGKCGYCTPVADKLNGTDADDDESPWDAADPDAPGQGVGGICPVAVCPYVAKRRTIEEVLDALKEHAATEHPEDSK